MRTADVEILLLHLSSQGDAVERIILGEVDIATQGYMRGNRRARVNSGECAFKFFAVVGFCYLEEGSVAFGCQRELPQGVVVPATKGYFTVGVFRAERQIVDDVAVILQLEV